jgi:transporter family-2 protein
MTALQSNSGFYAVLMLFAGIGIPIMATLNSGLGVKLQSPALAVSILLIVAFAVSIICVFFFDGRPKALYKPDTPLYFYLGGVLFVFYILSITWVAPRFGVGNAISCVLLGQILSIAFIDHFGLFHANQVTLNVSRLLGLCLMAIGVFLVVKK